MARGSDSRLVSPALKRLRLEAGLSVREVGKRMGRHSVSALHRMEADGFNPTIETVFAYLDATGCDLQDLADEMAELLPGRAPRAKPAEGKPNS